jgi:hypothetical protein
MRQATQANRKRAQTIRQNVRVDYKIVVVRHWGVGQIYHSQTDAHNTLERLVYRKRTFGENLLHSSEHKRRHLVHFAVDALTQHSIPTRGVVSTQRIRFATFSFTFERNVTKRKVSGQQ